MTRSTYFNGDGSTIHTLPGFATLANQLGIQLGISGLASDGDPAIAFSRDRVTYAKHATTGSTWWSQPEYLVWRQLKQLGAVDVSR